jgi:hypothetical protein
MYIYETVPLPTPKYPLTKYSTKQLLIWYEESVLYCYVALKKQLNAATSMEVALRRAQRDSGRDLSSLIRQVLLMRGVDSDYLLRIVDETWKDVNDDNE